MNEKVEDIFIVMLKITAMLLMILEWLAIGYAVYLVITTGKLC